MREQTGASVSASAGDDTAGGALFIITLNSSTTPMALEVPSLAELAGLAVFRSRKVEDGRDRFRLHLGYFESAAAAENVLPVVREHFPAAWVGPAPNSGMGSLDDTSVAQFKFIKAPNTIKSSGGTSTRLRALTAAGASAKHPPVASPAPPRMTLNASCAPASKPVAAVSRPQGRLAAAARATVPPRATAPKQAAVKPTPSRQGTAARATSPARAPAAAKPWAPKVTPTRLPTSPAVAAAAPAALPLAPRDVLNLLESRPSHQPGAQAHMQPRERAAVIGAIQRFAVQLIWSTDPLNLASVPKLAIFDAYTLYKVQVDRAGRRWYGLRLGFFGDAVSARQVALYARSDFSAAAVVPVSDRECDRAAQAAVKDLPQARPTPKAEVEMELIDVPRAAPKVDIGMDAPKATRPAPVAPIRPVTPAPAKIAVLSEPPPAKRQSAAPAAPKAADEGKSEKGRRLKSTAELAADLQADDEPQFEMAGDEDALNDTGVRHLAITVVNKRKAGIGKLFKRRGRR